MSEAQFGLGHANPSSMSPASSTTNPTSAEVSLANNPAQAAASATVSTGRPTSPTNEKMAQQNCKQLPKAEETPDHVPPSPFTPERPSIGLCKEVVAASGRLQYACQQRAEQPDAAVMETSTSTGKAANLTTCCVSDRSESDTEAPQKPSMVAVSPILPSSKSQPGEPPAAGGTSTVAGGESARDGKPETSQRRPRVLSTQSTRTMGSGLFPRPCLSHKPTLEELRSCSFSDFVRDVVLTKALPKFEDSDDENDFVEEDWCKTAMPLTDGIAKVSLPNGFWQEEGIGRDRTGRGPAWQKGQPLGDLVLESPISQHIRGMAGLYEFTFTDNPATPLSEFREKADKYRQGQVGDAFDEDADSDERLIQLDRHFWKRLGPTMPAACYGADQEGTLFGDDPASGWSLGELDTCLHVLNRVPGVTTPYLYAGMWASVFCAHTEDMNLLSINYLHAGAPKLWYAVAPGPDAKRFEALCEFQYSVAARECKEFMRHKRCLLSPMVLQKAGIKYTTAIQRPGDAVITMPGGYHFGFNTGFNVAEATNFGVPEWIPYGLQARVCLCRPDSVRIDMNRLISLLEMFEADRARRPKLSWKEWSRKREEKKTKGKAKKGSKSAVTKAAPSASVTASPKAQIMMKKKMSEQEKKNEFWIEVVKPAPKTSAPKARPPPVVVEEEGRGKRKRKKTMKAAMWEAETKKDSAAPAMIAEEVWHLAKPIGRKGVDVNAQVLCLLPGTVMSGPADEGGGDHGHLSEDEEDEQCFLAHVVEIAEDHVRVRLVGLPKSEEVWVPLGASKLFLDGGQWKDDSDQCKIPRRHYWNEMDSKQRTSDG